MIARDKRTVQRKVNLKSSNLLHAARNTTCWHRVLDLYRAYNDRLPFRAVTGLILRHVSWFVTISKLGLHQTCRQTADTRRTLQVPYCSNNYWTQCRNFHWQCCSARQCATITIILKRMVYTNMDCSNSMRHNIASNSIHFKLSAQHYAWHLSNSGFVCFFIKFLLVIIIIVIIIIIR